MLKIWIVIFVGQKIVILNLLTPNMTPPII